ncbi:ABC transporter permease [Fulvivirgaceae bacterium BMA10]|uniref:ABC transporter permease n=1 Tax=Splendidivirga corallicola TaxID=3051826 RepID=A0ABT8KUX1_9BACT|nr:ABC transporter permease [Fulvivirgaceae bacterium BMA10]
MIHNYLKLALRNLWKQKLFSAINFTGLILGFSAFLMIGLYVWDELSFDNFHDKKNRIYRLWDATATRHVAMTPYVWSVPLNNELPEIENIVTIQHLSLIVKQDDDVYAETEMFAADSTFFEIFDFPVLRGNPQNLLKDPNRLIITPEMATKYFGNTNPIGQTLEINIFGTFVSFEVSAIAACPENSHIQFDFLLPYELIKKYSFNPPAYENWRTHFVYTYLLMTPDFDHAAFKTKLKQFLLKHGGKTLYDRYTPNIQPLSHVYLKSNLEFDFQPKGSIKNVKILTVAAIGLLVIAIINFVNLMTSQYLRRVKEIAIKRAMGSDKSAILLQFLVESSLMAVASVIVAVGITLFFLPQLNDFTGKTFQITHVLNPGFIVISLITGLIIGCLAGIYPAFVMASYKPVCILRSKPANRVKSVLTRKILVIFQFILAVVLLMATGTINEQVDFMLKKDLGFNQDQVIVINDAGQISSHPDKTNLLREELLKNVSIHAVSASSSYPGTGTWSVGYKPEGYEDIEQSLSLSTIFADHDFINTYDIEIIKGRDLNRQIQSDSNAYLINEAAVQLFSARDNSWKTNPLNKLLEETYLKKKGPVIGVFKNFHFESLERKINPLIIHIYSEYFFFHTNQTEQ